MTMHFTERVQGIYWANALLESAVILAEHIPSPLSYLTPPSSLTVQSDTSTSLSFAGDRVALYGTYGSDYAIYSAQLDDGPTSIMNASRPTEPLSQQLLFQATGLEKGVAHNLTLTSLSQDGAKFAVDYAEVDGASNAMGKAANTSGTAGGSASESAATAGSETR